VTQEDSEQNEVDGMKKGAACILNNYRVKLARLPDESINYLG